ncbi:tRNA lysidine(34) synthetase TilS [Adhaeribacter aquaticus]|uniref:tRNA lysidine(34) synthetase TilS n=1 Tax=Adhaeribacter aquaticus TaxID=299567 RepID=UPI0003FAFCAA|nr:tRNA lysidine(34) synthetase TilS [Adhaeribacter aquaticus]
MTDKVLAFCEHHQLFTTTDKIVVAVSGGIDSVVLCDMLSKLKMDFGIAHCHFGLRAEEADADELFVKKLAKKYNVPFYSEHFNTKEYAEQEQLSIQMAARLLRYTWFEKIRQQYGYQYIATAHHQNDAAETILLNLTKGTGIAGLHGIPAKNNKIIRPLLCLTKDDIYDYVTSHQLIWREDSSNESTKYQRNLIRQEVIPVLKQINPNLENTLSQTVEKIKGAEAIFQKYIQEVKTASVTEKPEATYIDITALNGVTALPVVLFEILKAYNYNYEVVQNIVESFTAISGKTFESPTHILVKDREQLVITGKNLGAFGSYEIAEETTIFEAEELMLGLARKEATGYKIPRSRKIAALDAELLQFPLKVRTWKEGDWFVPLGMNGKKKISDFLIDEKIPANLKPKIKVITSDKSIVWIIGYRPDNRFKVTDKTNTVLEIEIKK